MAFEIPVRRVHRLPDSVEVRFSGNALGTFTFLRTGRGNGTKAKQG